MVLKELGLDYETKMLDFTSNFDTGEHKQPAYLKVNPNGRVPALVDHGSNDFTVWESCAMICYLTEKYDTEHSISFPQGSKEYAEMLQWLFFQASGQGPMWGQAGWFVMFHEEKLPSAITRYQKEVKRVLGVLESVLKDKEWLVGGKCTIADLSFVPWNLLLGLVFGIEGYTSFDLAKEFPCVNAWHQRMITRPAIKATLEDREKVMPKR